jgi:DNA mismatch repair protein MutS2
MLFDTEQLSPLYKLSLGQPGSSFTFEVATLNGIPKDLIAAAKGKVSGAKLMVDELTVALQKEKSELKLINERHLKSSIEAESVKKSYDQKLLRLTEKAEKQAAYFEQQNKYLNAGKRIFDLIKKHEKQETNKSLNESVKKYVAQEKTKIISLKKVQKEAAKKRKVKEEIKVNSALLMDQELSAPELPNISKKDRKNETEHNKPTIKKDFKVGDVTILKNTQQRGTIKEIKGNRVSVLVGNFVITTKLTEIE